jgi:hypothetical protein
MSQAPARRRRQHRFQAGKAVRGPYRHAPVRLGKIGLQHLRFGRVQLEQVQPVLRPHHLQRDLRRAGIEMQPAIPVERAYLRQVGVQCSG